MHFVVFGLTASSTWGNGHATIWRGILRALIARGHQVDFFERDRPYYANTRDLVAMPGLNLVLYSDWAGIERTADVRLRQADAGIVTSYCSDAVAATDLTLVSGTNWRLSRRRVSPRQMGQRVPKACPSVIG